MDNLVSTTQAAPNSSFDLNLQLKDLLADVTGERVTDPDLDLVDVGVLDSLALVSLIMELESKFELLIDYDDLEISDFRSLNSMTHFILRHKG